VHRSASLTILAVLFALAAPAAAGASTTVLGRLHMAGYEGREPARAGATLPGEWSPETGQSEGTPVLGHAEQRRDLGAGATCLRTVIVVGTTVRARERPTYSAGVLTLHGGTGWLLPRLTVTRRGAAAGGTRWYAGKTFAPETAPGVRPPTVQGIAVLPAPDYATRAGRGVVVVRVLVGAAVEKAQPAPGGGVRFVAPTPAEADRCFAPARRALPGILRSALRSARVVRRAGLG
jgi:hypothetical protein